MEVVVCGGGGVNFELCNLSKSQSAPSEGLKWHKKPPAWLLLTGRKDQTEEVKKAKENKKTTSKQPFEAVGLLLQP